MQFFGSNMTKSKAKWQWYRLGHNPGLVRITNGKQSVGVFHTLPCSLLKNNKRIEPKQLEPRCHQEEHRLPLSKVLTNALQRHLPEDIDD